MFYWEVKNLDTNHFKYLMILQNVSGAYFYLSIITASSLVQISSSHTWTYAGASQVVSLLLPCPTSGSASHSSRLIFYRLMSHKQTSQNQSGFKSEEALEINLILSY